MKWILSITTLFVGALVSGERDCSINLRWFGNRQKASEIDSKSNGRNLSVPRKWGRYPVTTGGPRNIGLRKNFGSKEEEPRVRFTRHTR